MLFFTGIRAGRSIIWWVEVNGNVQRNLSGVSSGTAEGFLKYYSIGVA